MSRHALGTADSWVELRDPHTLKSGDKRRVLRAIRDTEEAGAVALSMLDAIAVVAVESWSFPLPVPSQDVTALDFMEIVDYDLLSDLLGPTQKALFPDPVKDTVEQADDPASPTEPSAA